MNQTDPPLVHRTQPPSEGSPPYPGLLLLHGRGTNELDLLSLGPELDPRFFTVSAQAPYAFGPGSYYWYDLEAATIGQPTLETIEHSLGLIQDLIGTLASKYEIDIDRLFVGGFSQGGAMTAATVMTHPTGIAGAFIFSGYLPIDTGLRFENSQATGKPVFQAHGIYDDVLPIDFGRRTGDYLRNAGLDLTYREYPIPHSISPEELADARAWVGPRLDAVSR